MSGALATLVKSAVPDRLAPLAYNWHGWLVSRAYLGKGVHCPCCGGDFRKFRSFGRQKRPGAMCPRCRSLERHRLIWLYLRRRTGLFSEELKVLHFAPEYRLQKALGSLPNLEYVSADLRSPLADLKTDITEIRCADASFDVILCVHVLEHVADDRKAMRELHRVMRPGGWGIIHSPVKSGFKTTVEDPSAPPRERRRRFGQSDHVRRYGLDFADRLREAGFEVSPEPFIGELDAAERQSYGLGAIREDHTIFVCARRLEETGSGRAG